MSELKFVCPSCGQLMQCEKAYVGHEIPCPTCSAPLRIPLSDSPGGTPGAPPRAHLVLSALVEKEPLAASGLAPVVQEKPVCVSEIPKQVVVSRERVIQKQAQTPQTSQTDCDAKIHCICPVCQSELQVSAERAGTAPPATAELVRKGTDPEKPSTSAAAAVPQQDAASAQSALEREKQIAAARAAHPVELYPSIKPRLSYILSGGQKPVENKSPADSATKPEEKAKDQAKAPGSEHSFSE